jgi:hypothetical protein
LVPFSILSVCVPFRIHFRALAPGIIELDY